MARKPATRTVRADSDVWRYITRVRHELEDRRGRHVTTSDALAVIVWLGEEAAWRERRDPYGRRSLHVVGSP